MGNHQPLGGRGGYAGSGKGSEDILNIRSFYEAGNVEEIIDKSYTATTSYSMLFREMERLMIADDEQPSGSTMVIHVPNYRIHVSTYKAI